MQTTNANTNAQHAVLVFIGKHEKIIADLLNSLNSVENNFFSDLTNYQLQALRNINLETMDELNKFIGETIGSKVNFKILPTQDEDGVVDRDVVTINHFFSKSYPDASKGTPQKQPCGFCFKNGQVNHECCFTTHGNTINAKLGEHQIGVIYSNQSYDWVKIAIQFLYIMGYGHCSFKDIGIYWIQSSCWHNNPPRTRKYDWCERQGYSD